MKKIIDWFLDKRLKWVKKRALHEIERDIDFIKNFRSDVLQLDETFLRSQLAEEKKKEKLDEDRIYALSSNIAELSATKSELENLERAARELPRYIEML